MTVASKKKPADVESEGHNNIANTDITLCEVNNLATSTQTLATTTNVNNNVSPQVDMLPTLLQPVLKAKHK
jgi:hypothetical protein